MAERQSSIGQCETSQFGEVGFEVASCADNMLNHLSSELGWTKGDPLEWEAPDCYALDAVVELEWLAPLMDIPDTINQQRRERLHQAFLALHVALPFNEAERAWLPTVRGEESDDPLTLPSTFESQEGHIMIAGVRRPVSGHDLMSRWLAWRRQTDEYQDQGSLEQARKALKTLGEMLGGA